MLLKKNLLFENISENVSQFNLRNSCPGNLESSHKVKVSYSNQVCLKSRKLMFLSHCKMRNYWVWYFHGIHRGDRGNSTLTWSEGSLSPGVMFKLICFQLLGYSNTELLFNKIKVFFFYDDYWLILRRLLDRHPSLLPCLLPPLHRLPPLCYQTTTVGENYNSIKCQ